MSALSKMDSKDHNSIEKAGLDSDSSEVQEDFIPRKFLWWIPLQKHVHPVQFFFFIVTVFVSLTLIVYIAGTQPQILSSILLIKSDEGDITGSLSLYSEVTSVIGVIVWSLAADKIERKGVMSISIIIMAICVIAYPHVHNVYPDMLIIRLVFSVGTAGSTAMMAAMMMEVVHGKGGLVSGCIGIASGLGAVFAALVLFKAPAYFYIKSFDARKSLASSHGIVGGCCIAIGIASYFVLPKDVCKRENPNQFKALGRKLYRGIKAAKDPRVALGYVSSFFARADEIIITNFLTLWINKYYLENGKCEVGKVCLYGSASSSTLSGYSQIVALASTPFFSLASEYLPKEWAVIIAGIIGACGCIPFAFSFDPTTKAAMGYVIMVAIGQYGMIISGMAMIAGDFITVEDRAAISACYSFIGVCAIIIFSKLGGVLFDEWMKGAPFLLLGIGHCLIVLMAAAVYIIMRIKKRKDKTVEHVATYDIPKAGDLPQ
ncbi:major facilitator superfamily domain-containing protein [Pilobolus umbonatus]|nr:major facilitator superfamily domain-containing protein [Pilobolus umbonatus]